MKVLVRPGLLRSVPPKRSPSMKHLRPLVRPLAHHIAVAACSASAQTTSGSWTLLNSGNASGSWATPANWQGGSVAGGVDALADFSTLNITVNPTVTLDGPRTVGTLRFGDAVTASHDWILDAGTGGPLTLEVSGGVPSIHVVNRMATINTVLAGSADFNLTGAGTLTLTAANTFLAR